MSLTYSTAFYNGVEKTLADWGIVNPTRTPQNQGDDIYTCSMPVAMDSDPLFPFDALVIFKTGRTANRVNPVNATTPASNTDGGGALTFSGGVQEFWGYALEPQRTGSADGESLSYKFIGPYQRWFSETVFAKFQLTYSPALGKQIIDWQTDIVLGLSLTVLTGTGDTVQDSTATNLMSIGQQVKEICGFAQMVSYNEAASNGLGWPAGNQFNCDLLTAAIDGINYDLLQTPSTNVLLKDYANLPQAGQTSASTLPTGSYMLRAPLDAANNITCAEAMRRQLQWLGGIGTPVVWTDHSQTPPQLHIATRDQMTNALAVTFNTATGALTYPGGNTIAQRLKGGNAITLPMNPAGQPPNYSLQVKQDIRKCTELIPAAVHLRYKIQGSVLSVPYSVLIDDIAAYINGVLVEGVGEFGALTDLSGTPLGATVEGKLRAAAQLSRVMVEDLDLTGANITGQTATITTTATNFIDPAGTGADGGFWQKVGLAHFANTTGLKFFDATHCPVTYTDPQTGATVDVSGLGYWLPDGQLASWMTSGDSPIIAQRVRVTGYFNYKESLPGAHAVTGNTIGNKEEHVDVILTNAVTGTYASTGIVFGEPVPYGLAGYILALESVPQYAGKIVIQETEITDICPIGNVLNLTGGRAEWSTMNAIVQSVNYNKDRGQTEITIGPAKHLSSAQFQARLRYNLGPRWYTLIAVHPLNSNQTDNSIPPNVSHQSASAGAKNATLLQLFTNLIDQQSTGSPPAVVEGILLDTGADSNPAGLAQGKHVFLSDGGTLSDPFVRMSLVDGVPVVYVWDGTNYAKLTAGELIINDGSGNVATLTPTELIITNGTDTSTLTKTQLTITNGTDILSLLITDITGLGTAKMQATEVCQTGVNYTAKWMRTNLVAV